MIESKIIAGAENIRREYSSQKKLDKKTLAIAEATLLQSRNKVETITEEISRFRSLSNSGFTPLSPVNVNKHFALKKELSVSGFFSFLSFLFLSYFFIFSLLLLTFNLIFFLSKDLDHMVVLANTKVSTRIRRLQEKIEIELTIKVVIFLKQKMV